jgi:hypothetical protein
VVYLFVVEVWCGGGVFVWGGGVVCLFGVEVCCGGVVWRWVWR